MKPRMYLWKGWIRFDPNKLTNSLNWITKSRPNKNGKSYHYFLPNKVTRELFAYDILPHIKDFDYTVSDLLYLRNFKMVPVDTSVPVPTLPGVAWFPHQREALEFASQRSYAAIYLGTGTGKTLTAVGLLSTLPSGSDALVLTPKKVIPDYRETIDRFLVPANNVIVTNYEQLNTASAANFLKDWGMIILDESHKVKNFTATTVNNLKTIIENTPRRYLFTGTPQDKSRSEIFTQLSILDSKFMPTKTDFINRYFNIDEYYNPTSEKLPHELDSMIGEVCFGYKTEDVVNLPDEVHRIFGYSAPNAYWEMVKNRIFEDGGRTYIADSPATLKIRLRQICSGFCVDDKGDTHSIHLNLDSKIARFTKLMQKKSKGTQCIVFTEFDWEQKAIVQTLDALNISYCQVNGKLSSSICNAGIKTFQSGGCEILVVQSRSGGAGLNLQNCNHTIFFSLPESSIVFEQCKGRTRRIGQTEKCYYYYLIGNGTIEQTEMLDNLKIKETKRAELFNLFEGGNKVGTANT